MYLHKKKSAQTFLLPVVCLLCTEEIDIKRGPGGAPLLYIMEVLGWLIGVWGSGTELAAEPGFQIRGDGADPSQEGNGGGVTAAVQVLAEGGVRLFVDTVDQEKNTVGLGRQDGSGDGIREIQACSHEDIFGGIFPEFLGQGDTGLIAVLAGDP